MPVKLGKIDEEKNKKKRLDDDRIIKILEDAESGKFTTKEIAERNGVSLNSVYRYLNIYGVRNIKRRERKTKNKEQNTEEEINKNESSLDLEEINLNNGTFVCSITDSKNISSPTKNYIFNSEQSMTDYEFLNKKCMEYVKEHIPFKNGVAQKDMLVYVKGGVGAILSLVRACSILQVNLSFMHQDWRTENYTKQVVFDQYKSESMKLPMKIQKIISKAEKAYLYNSTAEDLIGTLKFYVLKETLCRNGSYEMIFSKSYNDILKKYSEKLGDMIHDTKNKKEIVVLEYKNTSYQECFMTRKILRSCNY